MRRVLKKVDRHLDFHLVFLLILALVVVLRLPNLFEPYWYGDEAIYLTIGNALNHGSTLYTDIIDHKTPLIYYLARVPSQLGFRVLLIGWMLATTTFFYALGRRLLSRSPRAVLVSTFIFALFTTLPAYEGNIPNGELFLMGFVLAGGWLVLRTHYAQEVLAESLEPTLVDSDKRALFVAGILFGLAILTKVPSLFDAAAFLSLGWLASAPWLGRALHTRRITREIWSSTRPNLTFIALLLIGIITPIGLSIMYFWSQGSGQDYLDYGLLYNFRYAQNWAPSTNPAINLLFSFPVKFALVVGGILWLTWYQALSHRFRFVAIWLVLALFASLLSNRPYPHYFLQLAPPFALLFAFAGRSTRKLIYWFSSPRRKRLPQRAALQLVTSGTLIAVTIVVLNLLTVVRYPTREYYDRWWQLVTGKLSAEAYQNSFNSFVRDNNLLRPIIAEEVARTQSRSLFIWGTNPMLYALTQTVPVGRFTVAFHIEDFDARIETLEQLKTHPPAYIVVMKNESDFPELDTYLQTSYIPTGDYETLRLWKHQLIR